MNEIVNKVLLVEDTFIPKRHLKQPWFIDSACGPLTKNKVIICANRKYRLYLQKWSW